MNCQRCLKVIARRAQEAPRQPRGPVSATSTRFRHAAGMVPGGRMSPTEQAAEIRRLRAAVLEVKRQVDLQVAQGRLGADEAATILEPIREHLPSWARGDPRCPPTITDNR